jgi:hypothetical protein
MPIGFGDEAFSELHHFKGEFPGHGIKSFRRYAESAVTEFKDNGPNPRTVYRMEVVWEATQKIIELGGKPTPSVFKLLAQAAWLALPEPE